MTAIYSKIKEQALAATKRLALSSVLAAGAGNEMALEVAASAFNIRTGPEQASSWGLLLRLGTRLRKSSSTVSYEVRLFCRDANFWGKGAKEPVPAYVLLTAVDRQADQHYPLVRQKIRASSIDDAVGQALQRVQSKRTQGHTVWSLLENPSEGMNLLPWWAGTMDSPPAPRDSEDRRQAAASCQVEQAYASLPPIDDFPAEESKPSANLLLPFTDEVKAEPPPPDYWGGPIWTRVNSILDARRTQPARLPIILVVDTETTGLDATESVVTELGVAVYSLAPEHDRCSGLLMQMSTMMGGALTSSKFVPADVDTTAPVTGISSEGFIPAARWTGSQGWMEERVLSLFSHEDVVAVLAHNAAFDRAFVDPLLPEEIREDGKRPLLWIDTAFTRPWGKAQFMGDRTNLRDLVLSHKLGISSAHRALADVDMITRVLDLYTEDEYGDPTRVDLIDCLWKESQHLWWDPNDPAVQVVVHVSYESRDVPKGLGLQWDPENKNWRKICRQSDVKAIRDRIHHPDKVFYEILGVKEAIALRNKALIRR
jgi:DNA polymerase III epsilon subunit-like protein